MSFPEVAYACRQGRARDTSTDPAPLNMTETDRPPEAARSVARRHDLDRLARDERGGQLPGVSNIWTMPIINRIDMLTTGIRSEVGCEVFGTI
jgi:Cu(I)/Ag(I) efflux system membrane protein CusA/SilA